MVRDSPERRLELRRRRRILNRMQFLSIALALAALGLAVWPVVLRLGGAT